MAVQKVVFEINISLAAHTTVFDPSAAQATIVTDNVRDFPTEPLAALGISIHRPDDYLNEVFDNHPDEIARIVDQMATDRHRPPMSPHEVLDALVRAGVSRFAERVRAHLIL